MFQTVQSEEFMKTQAFSNTSINIIHQIAAFCGVRTALRVTAGITCAWFLFLFFHDYRTPTPLYIMLTCMVLPSLIQGAAFSNDTQKKEKEKKLPLPLFRKKYGYDSAKHFCLRLSHTVVILMFAAWHISFRASDTSVYSAFPLVAAAGSLLVRIGVTVYYRFYFNYNITNAMR